MRNVSTIDSNVATLPKRLSIAVGTVIELKSGGAPMTVTKRNGPDEVTCIWHDADGCLNEAIIPTAAVKVTQE